MREDPTFRVHVDHETSETIISGMGELHLEIYVERIRREYKVDCTVGAPKVSYREAPTRETPFNYKHRKQTGGSGQYAHVVGKLIPLDPSRPSSSFSRTRSPAADPVGIHSLGRKGLPRVIAQGTGGRLRGHRRAHAAGGRFLP